MLIILAMFAALLLNARANAWKQSEQETANIKQVILEDLRSQITRYSSLLDLAATLLGGAVPLPADASARLLKKMAEEEEVAGVMIVLDQNGNAVADSGKIGRHGDNFADRAYFSIHRDQPNAGLYISAPYKSRLRGGDPSIALSRRISDGEGKFLGVVVTAIRLEYFRGLFSKIDLGPGGAVALVNNAGTVLIRQPSADGVGDVGRDISEGSLFRHIKAGRTDPIVAAGTLDGVDRLVSFGHVPNFPLIVTVAQSTEAILADLERQGILALTLALGICGAIGGLALMLRWKVDALEAAREVLSRMAATDVLTGLANRREFDTAIRREWQRALRDRSALALLLIDADHFKDVNDRFGHTQGDAVLKMLGGIIVANLHRGGDFAARYGGEEFAVILANTNAIGATKVAEKVRLAVEDWKMSEQGRGGLGVTVSIGVAACRPDYGISAEDLVEAADQALYQAKARGRNRLCTAEMARNQDPQVVSVPIPNRSITA